MLDLGDRGKPGDGPTRCGWSGWSGLRRRPARRRMTWTRGGGGV